MQCTTKKVQPACKGNADKVTKLTTKWEELLGLLPTDLEERARTSGALLRRREIPGASELLQLILAYAVEDWSLRLVGAWGTLSGVVEVSDVTILNRLRQSVTWLEGLVAHLLREQVVKCDLPAVRLRLLDATVISRPGSKGSDWRIHMSLNLGEMQVDDFTLTDDRGGEGLHHFILIPGDIVVADRAYSYRKSLSLLLAQGASCVVRVRWTNLAGYTYQGDAFSVIDWLQRTFSTPTPEAQAVELQLTVAEGTFPFRLVACPLPPAAVAQARAHIRRKAQKQGKKSTQPSAETLFAAGFALLLTNLPAESWSAAQIGQLYRYRWQVELYFKRLKSIMHLDHLRARDPQLARAYLLAKLLAALLLDHLSRAFLAALPTWPLDLTHPLSRWRLTTLLWSSLHLLFIQDLLNLLFLADPARLRRYLCNSPRKRSQQDVLARLLLRSLSVVNVLPVLS